MRFRGMGEKSLMNQCGTILVRKLLWVYGLNSFRG
jgi:hypothetical protein